MRIPERPPSYWVVAMYGEHRGLVTSQSIEIQNCMIEFKILGKIIDHFSGKFKKKHSSFSGGLGERMLKKTSWSKKM